MSSVITSIKSEPIQPACQPAIDQPANKEIRDPLKSALKMNFSTRNRLITNLNQLFVILQRKQPISEDAKQRTRKKIDYAIRLLVDLSPFEPTQTADDSCAYEDLLSDQLIIELSREDRKRILNYLIEIKEVAELDEKIADETRRSLIAENRRISQLLEIPDFQDGMATYGVRSAEDTNDDEPSSKKRMSKRTFCFNP